MTSEEIHKMQPGVELDQEIGIRLFGASVESYISAVSGHTLYRLVCGSIGLVSDAWFHETGAWSAMPKFSITWEGMRLVVEAMAARGWSVSIQFMQGPSWKNAPWHVAIVDSIRSLHGTATNTTAPAAAAKAAILALHSESKTGGAT